MVKRRGRAAILGVALLAAIGTLLLAAPAKQAAILGDWTEPTGSVIRIGSCANTLCMWVVSISKQAPSTKDIYNPDPALRSRSLCGLKIGSGFVLRDSDHATEGTLYDPKSGKTYRGTMTVEGAMLRLRGYVGIPLFGRSETWTRVTGAVKACGDVPGGN